MSALRFAAIPDTHETPMDAYKHLCRKEEIENAFNQLDKTYVEVRYGVNGVGA